MPDPTTLCDLLDQSATRHGSRLALASHDRLRTVGISRPDLWNAANTVAHSLRDHDLKPGDRVVLLGPNGVRLAAILFGLFRAGIIAVPLDQNSAPDFVRAVMRKTGAAAIIAAPQDPRTRDQRVIDIGSFDLTEGAPFDGPFPAPSDLAEIVFTSGTTGDPKGVMLTHANIVANTMSSAQVIPASVSLDLLSVLPLSHMLEQTVGLLLPLWTGGNVHYAPSLHPSSLVAEMRRHRVRGMVVAPRFLQLMMSALERRVEDQGRSRIWASQNRLADRLPMALRRAIFQSVHRAFGGRLRFFMSGGAALPEECAQAWERLGVRVIEGYGTTECSPVIASNRYDDRVPGTVGRPLAKVEVQLSDDGELQVRGPNVFGGYWQDATRTAHSFTPDGWYKTDDVGTIGADGRIRITARMSERIVLPSGMKVYPADIETVLGADPVIKDCVVIGRPGPDGQVRVHAVIRAAEGTTDAAVGAAIASANTRLATHQHILEHTIWTGDFPRTALQKVKRKQVRDALDRQTTHLAASAAPVEPPGSAAAILRRIIPTLTGPITPETRLSEDLGLDSLARIELASQIEEDTGRDLPEDRINTLQTVADLSAILATPSDTARPVSFADWPLSKGAVAARWALQSTLLFALHKTFCRPFRVIGASPPRSEKGPFLIIANHSSHADTVSILRALPPDLRQRTTAAAASDYFYSGPVRGALASLALNTFPFSRAGQVRASLERCGRLCDDGWSILIYPEGTRSVDGRLLPFKSGIGLLATGLNVPVLPVAVSGGHDVLPKGATWPRRAPVTVQFGAPVIVPVNMTPEDATAMLRQAVAALMDHPETSVQHAR